MTTVDLRVPADVHATMTEEVTQRIEWAGYLLCGVAREGQRWTLLGREWCSVPAHHRIADSAHGMTWHPDFDVEMLNRAQRENLACVVVHYHGGKSPAPSHTDKDTRDSLMPFLSSSASNTPHIFLVLGDRALHGDAFFDGTPAGSVDWMRVTGSWLDDWGRPEPPRLGLVEARRHDRSIRAFGADGQMRLKHARVGVIGCGGGGAHVVQQLAYLGVASFVLIDGDDVDETNLNRLVGAFPAQRLNWVHRLIGRKSGDVGTAKVDVMARLIRRINRDANVTARRAWFPSQETIDVLRTCDVLVACVGLQIHPSEKPLNAPAIAGRVTKVLADGPCLRCQGVVDDNKLSDERGGQAPGYTGPARIPDPAVVTLNGIVASIAATEVLQLITGFAGGRGPNGGWIYDGVTGSVDQVQKNVVGCSACLAERGRGQVLA